MDPSRNALLGPFTDALKNMVTLVGGWHLLPGHTTTSSSLAVSGPKNGHWVGLLTSPSSPDRVTSLRCAGSLIVMSGAGISALIFRRGADRAAVPRTGPVVMLTLNGTATARPTRGRERCVQPHFELLSCTCALCGVLPGRRTRHPVDSCRHGAEIVRFRCTSRAGRASRIEGVAVLTLLGTRSSGRHCTAILVSCTALFAGSRPRPLALIC